ncbi:MAG TPA: DMT family transporter [Ideonella sp.]|jgi:drug/metabolite transporter (DMT)-like permease|nr:DMT family transporter [Ideonella sp.]
MKRWQADGLLLAVAAIWGLAFVPQSWGMQNLGPMGFTGLRFLLGALVVAPLAWREHRRSAPPPPAGGPPRWLLLLGLGTLIFLGAALQQIGLVTTSVTNASFLTALYVPLVPLLGWALFGRRPHPIVWPAALGCVAGTWLLTGAGRLQISLGDAWVIASSLPWALHVVLIGWAAGRLGAPYTVACAQFVVCGVLGLLTAWAIEPLPSWQALHAAAGAIGYTGLVSVGIGYTAQVLAQRHTHAADAALLLSSETVFAALFGAWLAGDRLEPTGLAGCALILACIVASQLGPLWRYARAAR